MSSRVEGSTFVPSLFTTDVSDFVLSETERKVSERAESIFVAFPSESGSKPISCPVIIKEGVAYHATTGRVIPDSYGFKDATGGMPSSVEPQPIDPKKDKSLKINGVLINRKTGLPMPDPRGFGLSGDYKGPSYGVDRNLMPPKK